jgi:hypothetical protein
MLFTMNERSIFTLPSFYAHIFGGFLLFVAILVLFMNYTEFTSIYFVYILLLFSIAATLHGLSHQGFELRMFPRFSGGCPCKRAQQRSFRTPAHCCYAAMSSV